MKARFKYRGCMRGHELREFCRNLSLMQLHAPEASPKVINSPSLDDVSLIFVGSLVIRYAGPQLNTASGLVCSAIGASQIKEPASASLKESDHG